MRLELAECTIRSWQLEDVPSLAKHANNRNVWLMLRDRMPHPYTLAHAVEHVRERLEEPDRPMFCIDVGGEAVGGIGLHPGNDVARFNAELGYWLAEPFWGRGIMTAAVRALVRYGFEQLPLNRIEAYVYETNQSSARVLEKCGFALEGRLRKSVVKDGCVLDSLLYATVLDD